MSCVLVFEYILFVLIYTFVQYSLKGTFLLFPSPNLPGVFSIVSSIGRAEWLYTFQTHRVRYVWK